MLNKVDRVEKLVRLATNNPNEEEAKLAALKACVIIHDKGLFIREKHSNPLIDHKERDEAADEIRRKEQARRRAEWIVKKREEARKAMVTRIKLAHRHLCTKCEEIIPIKTEVIWLKGGTGVFHLNCWVEHCAGV